MRRILGVLVGVVLGAVISGGVALATGGLDRDGNEPAPATEATEALGGAQAPSARLAVVVDGSATTGTFSVIRGKNVLSVTNPVTGVYCIRPKASANITVGAAVAIVTTEYSGTPQASYFVNWDRSPDDCGPGRFEIQGFELPDGNVNDVGFAVVVP